MDCWSEKVNYHKEYVYVSGHTHRNQFYDDGETRIYADNQIGYSNNNPHLKWLEMDNEYDYFTDYEDGIHQITGYDRVQFIPIGVYTIMEVRSGKGSSAGWGRLKSGIGWISLDFVRRL